MSNVGDNISLFITQVIANFNTPARQTVLYLFFFLIKFEWKHQIRNYNARSPIQTAGITWITFNNKSTKSEIEFFENNSEFYKIYEWFSTKHPLKLPRSIMMISLCLTTCLHPHLSLHEILGIVFFVMRATRLANTKIEMERWNQLFFQWYVEFHSTHSHTMIRQDFSFAG